MRFIWVFFALIPTVVIGSPRHKAEWYVLGGTGFQFAINKKATGTGLEVPSGNFTANRNKLLYSAGSGNILFAGLGLKVMEGVRYEFALEQLTGTRQASQFTRIDSLSYRSDSTLSSFQFRFNPSLVLFLKVAKKVPLTFKLGVIVPIHSRIKEDFSLNTTSFRSAGYAIIKHKASIGFNTSIHSQAKINEKLFFFGGFQLQLLNSYRRTRTVKYYTDTDGKTLNQVFPDTYDKQTTYLPESEVQKRPVNNKNLFPASFNPDKPAETLTIKTPFSSFGIQFGFVYLLY